MLLSLFDYSGDWSRPYAEAGVPVLMVDIGHPRGLTRWKDQNVWTLGVDLTKEMSGDPRREDSVYGRDVFRQALSALRYDSRVGSWPTGVLAAPPCTTFTRAAARCWPRQDASGETAAMLSLVDFTLEFCRRRENALRFWVMENPPGRLWKVKGGGLRQDELGKPVHKFDPWQYGALAPEDRSSRRTKKTYLWGRFNVPPFKPHPEGKEEYPAHLPPQRRDPIRQMGSRNKRERQRTPPGFARAFFEANPL